VGGDGGIGTGASEPLGEGEIGQVGRLAVGPGHGGRLEVCPLHQPDRDAGGGQPLEVVRTAAQVGLDRRGELRAVRGARDGPEHRLGQGRFPPRRSAGASVGHRRRDPVETSEGAPRIGGQREMREVEAQPGSPGCVRESSGQGHVLRGDPVGVREVTGCARRTGPRTRTCPRARVLRDDERVLQRRSGDVAPCQAPCRFGSRPGAGQHALERRARGEREEQAPGGRCGHDLHVRVQVRTGMPAAHRPTRAIHVGAEHEVAQAIHRAASERSCRCA
jgi:hypothetical protein